ncbi:FAD-dependent oxidoreductase [Chloroflexota bacterium]
MTQLKKLFEPGRIGTLELKNRIIMAPMGTFSADEKGRPTERMIDYYVARADGGVGLIIVQFTAIMANARGGRYHLAIYDDSFISPLRELTQAVKSHGARIALQLAHHGAQLTEGGRLSGFGTGEQDVVAPSAVPYMKTGVTPRELSIPEIKELVEAFGEGARRAREAGFDAVEFHGAHGKLINQFLCPYYNRRTDEYGGSLQNRCRFACEILSLSRKKVGPDFPISFRMNAVDGFVGGVELEDALKQVPLFVEAGADVLHVSSGTTDGAHWQFISYYQPPGMLVPFAEAVKKVVTVPVITVGRLGDPEVAERALQKGKADFVAMGRPLLADPELPNKAREGKLDEINRCINCNNCLASIWRSGFRRLRCTINPSLAREKEFAIKPADSVKKVMVIGGGLAGMKAASVLAQRRHQVFLFEKEDKLGGQWNTASRQPFKEHITGVTSDLIRDLKRARVNISLEEEVTPQFVREFKPDAVVVATGAKQAWLDVPGVKGENVVQSVDFVLGKAKVGEKVIVVGGRYLGMEVALELAEKGKKVSLVSRREIGRDVEWAMKKLLKERLVKNGVYLYPDSTVAQINEDGVTIVNNHDPIFLEADTVVLAVGFQPEDSLAAKLEPLVSELYKIGDCVTARDALEAITEGAEIGRQI